MTAPFIIVMAALVLIGGALLARLRVGHRRDVEGIALAATTVAAICIAIAAAKVLLRGPDPALSVWDPGENGISLRVYVDGLSAVFLVLIALVAVPAVFYSIPYLAHYREYDVARYYPPLLLFLAGMVGLVTIADTMFFFFLCWQLMTLASFALIRFEHRRPENRRAAWKYLWMMQAACGMIMAGAWLLAPETATTPVGGETLGRFDFDAIGHHLPHLLAAKSGHLTAALALFLAGFGIKAGMWPFGQMWLPDAHPAAPSPVSALLSGVMIKTGVYGLLRSFLWLMPAGALGQYPLEQWGMIIASLGTATLTIGTVQALHQKETKRLLAYSSIGQVGYILLGLGVCLALLDTSLVPVAVLALIGALFHTLNHGLFKALLFLNAGTMLSATGTQDLNRMGGLAKVMPRTALATGVGVLSIAGAPLTSGYASKWFLCGAAITGASAAPYLPICGLFAVMTSALTLAVFVRFFGAGFLSRTSATVNCCAQNRTSLDPGWMMLGPKLFLAGLCVMLGLLPALGMGLAVLALDASRQGLGQILAAFQPVTGGLWQGLSDAGARAVLAPLVVAVVLAATLWLARALAKSGGVARRAAAPWLCGYALETEQNRYQAKHHYGILRRYLRWTGGLAQSRPPET